MVFSSTGSAIFPNLLISSSIHLGDTISSASIKVTFTGTIIVYLSSNAFTNVVEAKNIISGVVQSVTFTTTGNDLRYKIVGEPGAIITYIEIFDYL